MASLEATPLLEEKVEAGSSGTEVAQATGWEPSAIVVDIATLGTGTLLAGLFSVALVFVVPKLITVEDYGYWRMFGLYAGYVGFLHFGFTDGALLRWAGQPMEKFHHEIGPAMMYLFWQHVVVLAPLCVLAALFLSGPLRFVGIAVAIYAPLFNLTSTLQFGLQSARIFRPVAISTVAAPALFCTMVLVWASMRPSNSQEVTVLFLLAWCVPLIFLLVWTKPWQSTTVGVRWKGLAKDCVARGWPILMANGGMILMVYADRLAVSWAATIQNFAQYSMAASAMAVPITAIQACSKVFFSHLAGVTAEDRRRIYGISSLTLLVAWAFLLPYYFALDLIVQQFIPKYTPSLRYARVLLLGIPFLASIQVLQMSYAYLNGMQRRFLIRTVAVLAVSLGATSYAAFHSGSLRTVAGVQVALLGGWWLFNEWTLRGLTGQGALAWKRFGFIYALTSMGYWLTTARAGQIWFSVLEYYVCLAVALTILCRNELGMWFQFVRRRTIARSARIGGEL